VTHQSKSLVALVAVVGLAASLLFAQDAGDAARDKFEKVADILAALEVTTASRVADVGAGDGCYSVRIARAMPPGGRVTAVDVTEKALEQLRQRLERETFGALTARAGFFAIQSSCMQKRKNARSRSRFFVA